MVAMTSSKNTLYKCNVILLSEINGLSINATILKVFSVLTSVYSFVLNGVTLITKFVFKGGGLIREGRLLRG